MNQVFSSYKLPDIDFQPGQIMFKGERFVLMNAEALGMLSRDLISTLGRERAKAFLLRYGWECGYKDSISIKNLYPQATIEFLHNQAPIYHMQEGVAKVQVKHLHADLEKGSFSMVGIWHDSYEATQHIQNFGIENEPVCWTLVGYASGVSTAIFGKKIIYKEVTCIGRGDDECRYVGKTVDEWGSEIESELVYYNGTKIAEELEEAHLKIKEQNKLLQQIMDTHEQLNQMVLSGRSRQDIIDMIGQLLQSPIVFQDKYFRLLNSWLPPTENTPIDQYLLDPMKKGFSELQMTLSRLTQEKQAEDLAFSDRPDFPKRTVVPIIVNDDVMGYLSVIHVDGTDQEMRRMITERAAQALAFDLLKEITALNTENKLKGDFLDELVSGSSSLGSLEKRVNYMGFDFHKAHRFMIIQLDESSAQRNPAKNEYELRMDLRKELINIVRYQIPPSIKDVLIVERRGKIILLAPTHSNGLNLMEIGKTLQKRKKDLLKNVRMSIFISRESSHISELKPLFEECTNTIDIMARLKRAGEIYNVEDMNLFDLLYAGREQDKLHQFANQTLEKLLEYEEDSGGNNLLLTLHVFLANDCNLQKSAKDLNVSLSGLKYRIQRLKDIGEIDFNDGDQKFNLQLALRVLIANGMIHV
ncbi:XylR N-terminal domain-containing protein [Neobacillus cucumis]|uniref:XylR N-terminal domain-containing protein n=1 Tax=Neobacillus cucumis TaxID=1740721 RepID=UPI00203C3F00|nr:XylR N-terminal domain-containing protein [Neobacillus cucumis]MCM3729537.1 XylR N-terminal domain-containing protein [Neobacillus cucumis]